MKLRVPLVLLVSLYFAGCYTVTDDKAEVARLASTARLPREFIVVGDNEYDQDLLVACAKYHIKLRPISMRSRVTDAVSRDRLVQYETMGFRYALNLTIRHDYSKTCVFSNGHVVYVTMSVIDAQENETLLVIKQMGPDKECPPLTPVWDLLAKELANCLPPVTPEQVSENKPHTPAKPHQSF